MWALNQIAHQDVQSYIRDARDYTLIDALILRQPVLPNDNCVAHAPFALFPTTIPRALYEQCLSIQPIASKLMLSIANDIQFMDDTLSEVVQVDDFTRTMLKINKIIEKEGRAQSVISCINRSDYLLDRSELTQNCLRMRQVEMNAIASSMSGPSDRATKLHKYLLTKYRIKTPKGASMPDNNALDTVSQGLIDIYNQYGKPDSYILVLTTERTLTFADQLSIELAVHHKRPDIRFVRRSCMSLPESIKLGPNKELLLDDSKEVAVVYFRSCYDPTHCDFDNAWDMRLLLERSRAIKCPPMNFHISGAKKFQQALDTREKLERFLEPNEARQLSDVFCKFWSIEQGNSAGEEGFQLGLSGAKNLVLKPQREGGGHNIFGSDVKLFLERLSNSEQRSQYILMEYIDSPREKNWLLVYDQEQGLPELNASASDQLVSELGIYGSILADGTQIKSNKAGGYLIRSKRYGVLEGGVAAGYAGLGSVLLVDKSPDNFEFVS